MKRLILLCLVFAMTLPMAACGCDHASAALRLSSVDTTQLTMEQELYCSDCNKVVETKSMPVGIAPVNSVFHLSPEDWFACLSTNLSTYDTSGALIPLAAESQDDAALYSVISLGGFRSVMSFYDSEDNVLTVAQASEAGNVHRIRLEAQFENATAGEFYTLLLIIAMTNNSGWDSDSINILGQQIMGGEAVTDNGYSYSMQILSVEDHTVAVNIVAE